MMDDISGNFFCFLKERGDLIIIVMMEMISEGYEIREYVI